MMQQGVGQQKSLIMEGKSMMKLDNTSDESIMNIARRNVDLQINLEGLEIILKKYLSYQDSSKTLKKHNFRIEGAKILKKPPMSEPKFSPLQLVKQRFMKIMTRAYHHEELKLGQFEQISQFFKLVQNKVKMINYLDPVILQTLRYAIYNKQQIPNYLVKIVNQMAKTNLAKQWENNYFMVHEGKFFKILSESFEPPLDLYLEFLDTNLIKPAEQQLKEVFTRNQFLFKALSHDKDFYPTSGQKKRLIYNQFPYLLEIFDRICEMDPANYDFGGLKLYLNTVINFFEFPNEDYLFQRYLPEVKCRHLKIKSNLNISDIQFLFVTLKTIQNLTKDDYKLLYYTKPNKTYPQSLPETKSCKKFNKIIKLTQQILINKQFHLKVEQLDEMSQILNYENCNPKNVIKMNLILFMMRQQSYNNVELPKSVIDTVSWILRNIPDRKIKKQCCYILLSHYPKQFQQNFQERRLKYMQQDFPQFQINSILQEGRQLALDLLINQQDKNLVLSAEKCDIYVKILKNLINCTKNVIIRRKSMFLYHKLNKINKFQSKDLLFHENDIQQSNQLVQLLEIQTKNGHYISSSCIKSILKILLHNSRPTVRRSCLATIKYAIKNHSNGQTFPEKFQEIVPQFINCIFFQPSMTEETKNQMVKVIVECTYLTKAYAAINTIANFLLEVFMKSQPKSSLQTNSSFGLYAIAYNFKQKSEIYYEETKKFLNKFATSLLKTYKDVFVPNNKSSINILCAIVALAKNQIPLPGIIGDQLTSIALKNKKTAQIVLLAIFFHLKNENTEKITEKSLSNILQILKQDKNRQMLVVNVLLAYLRKQKTLPASIANKIKQLSRIANFQNNDRQHISYFYKRYLQSQFQKSEVERYWVSFKNLQEIQVSQKLYHQLQHQSFQELDRRIKVLNQLQEIKSYKGDLLDLKCLGICQNVRIFLQITEKVDYIDNICSNIILVINVENLKKDKKIGFIIKQNYLQSKYTEVSSVLQIFAIYKKCDLGQIVLQLMRFYQKIREKRSKQFINMLISHQILEKCGLYSDLQAYLRDLIILLELNLVVGKLKFSEEGQSSKI